MMKKVFIDLGHGGTDPGAVGNNLLEKVLTRKIGEYMKAYLEMVYEGVLVRLSRNGDETKSLKQRTDDANAWEADVLTSIHINSATTASANGFESHIYPNSGISTVALQNLIHSEIIQVMKAFGISNDRGKKQSNFHMLRDSNMVACLTENLFIVNAYDANRLKQEEFLKAVGEAHARGVAKFIGLKQKVVAQSVKPSITYQAHIQSIGWQEAKKDGQTAGTTGKSMRLEALTVRLANSDAVLEMEAHIQDKGWTPVRTNGEIVGTIGEALRLEAIKIKCNKHTVSYRAHVQDIGWTDWKKNGEVAGTVGQSKRIEAIEIKLG